MTTRKLGVRQAMLDGTLIPGDVTIADGAIEAVGVSPPGRDGTAVPGFVDLQVNGFAGVDFLSTDAAGVAHASQALASYGVTAYQPTLVSSPPATTIAALEQISKANGERGAKIIGVHLEGPFIAPKWKGAHDERYIVPPDLDLADELCGAGEVTYMTIAPEQPGGFDLLDHLVERGIVVSLGHSDADAATAHAAYNRGARTVTHLYNAQRRFTARDPGLTGVALTRADVVVQVIADLVHLAAETVLGAYRCARDQFAVVTDCMSAAESGDGEYPLGDRTVFVSNGAARLVNGTLAGSVLTMDRAVRNLVSIGVPWIDAIRAATRTPAEVVARPELGSLRRGTPADIVVLDEGLYPLRTIVDGAEVWRR